MDSLVSRIIDETGIPKEAAEKIVGIVMQRMKDLLPAGMSVILDSLIQNESADGSAIGIAKGIVGGFFGSKKAA